MKRDKQFMLVLSKAVDLLRNLELRQDEEAAGEYNYVRYIGMSAKKQV